MVWAVNYQLARGKRIRIWGGVFLCWVCLMLATPKIPHSPKHHLFADMRNFLGISSLPLSPSLSLCLLFDSVITYSLLCYGLYTGVPNTLNVITNFPFLIVGVLGFVLCLQGNLFAIRFLCSLSLSLS